VLLDTIPGVGDLLELTPASEVGDVARFSSPRKLTGYAGLAPKINQSGDRPRTGVLSKAGSRTLRWTVVEAAQHAWRPSNPWHQLYTDLAARAGKNPGRPPSRARSSSPPGTCCRATSPSSPPRHAPPILPRQAPAAF
jgi:transposase